MQTPTKFKLAYVRINHVCVSEGFPFILWTPKNSKQKKKKKKFNRGQNLKGETSRRALEEGSFFQDGDRTMTLHPVFCVVFAALCCFYTCSFY